MSALRGARTAAALTVAGALVVAGTSAADAAAGRATLTVSASSRHHVTVARTTRPGVVHLHNKSSHELLLVKKKHKGISTLVKDGKENDSAASTPKMFRDFDVVVFVDGHADDYTKLTKGTYYLVDVSTESVKASQVATITVEGRTSNAHVPGSRLVKVTDSQLIATSTMVKGNYLHVVNASAGGASVVAFGIRTSATDKQIQDALNDRSGEKLDDIGSGVFATVGFVGAHHDVTTRSALGRGRYFLFQIDLAHPGAVFARGTVRLLTVR